jgi:hypothetical protein
MALETQYNGRTYEWDDGQWFDVKRHMVAPEAIRSELNSAFIRSVEQPGFVGGLEDANRRLLFNLLRENMGVSLTKLSSMGFFEEVLSVNPELALASLFSHEETPSGRSFVNCKRLRDRFFAAKTATPFELPVKLLGNGPFDQADFKEFLKKCRVPMWKRNTPVNVLILGRDDWKPEAVNEIVEDAEGAVLQIYSQEMLISVLAGHPDPFRVWPLRERLWDMYAFRDGHPGLEYVSNGWAGWIKGVGFSSAVSWGDGTSDFNQVEQSPLSAMGYRAGVSGLDEGSRRRILRSAFEGPLPFVESSAYMEGWGSPTTAERLKRIAYHLSNMIDTHRHRTNLHVAVHDWETDLAWLKNTFYRGVATFYWPQV